MEKDKKKKPLINTFAKLIVFICLIFGMVLTIVSYVYAYLGIDPLIDLSSVLITTVVSPVLTFLIENALCDVFQHNKLSFSTPLSYLYSESSTVENIDNSEDTAND